MTLKLAILILLGGPLLLMAGYAVHCLFKYTRMICNIFLGLSYAFPTELPSASRGEKISILDSADHEIQALFLEKKGASKIVIFCPESGITKEAWEKYAYFFPDLGYHVLSVDLPDDPPKEQTGISHFPWASWDDAQRLLTVIRWTKKALSPDIKIVLFGISKGANIAYAASLKDRTVSAVIADGLFSMKAIFRDYIRRWAPVLVRRNIFKDKHPDWIINTFTELGFWYCGHKCRRKFLSIENLLHKKHPPLLTIHGEADDYISASHQALLEKVHSGKCPIERLVVPMARHNEAVSAARQTYETRIKAFLEKNL